MLMEQQHLKDVYLSNHAVNTQQKHNAKQVVKRINQMLQLLVVGMELFVLIRVVQQLNQQSIQLPFVLII